MDYKKIIVNGVLDENTRSHLDLYFYREYENAKEEKYSLIEFFSGLNKGIKELFTAIVNKREEKIKRLEEEIKLNELSPRPYDTPEQAKKEIERLKSKVYIILNSESSIDIENENYKTEITLKALESVLFNINRAFDRAKNNEGETMPPHQNEILIPKIVINTNKDLFQYSTAEQWQNFANGNFIDLGITIKTNAKLKNAVAVIDEIANRFNIDVVLKDFESYNVFVYKGKTLTAKQYSDARNDVAKFKLEHYFE